MVSIIVPVYKVEQYLRRCVDSIRSQTYKDLEIILVDDGSPDGCGAICDEYAGLDSRIRVIHKENGGVSSARNRGLEEARGNWVTFCDSDDFYEPQWIEVLVQAAESTQADQVRADLTFYHEDTSLNSRTWGETGVYDLKAQEDRAEYCFTKLFKGSHGWPVWSRLFCADIIRKNQIRFCETCGNFAEDMGFVLEYMLYSSRVASISEAGYLYFQRESSMMASSAGKVKLDCVNEVSLYFAQRSRKALTPFFARRVLPIFHFCILYNQYQAMMQTASPEEASDMIRRILRYPEWEAQTREIFFCEDKLKQYFGKRGTSGILRISGCCLNGDWKKTIRQFRSYKKWEGRGIWMKEVLQRITGGEKCRK